MNARGGAAEAGSRPVGLGEGRLHYRKWIKGPALDDTRFIRAERAPDRCGPAYLTPREGGFPPREMDWGQLIPYIGPAAAAVARYDGLLSAIPSPDVLLSPLTTQEAVLSSRIEGTQATMGEVLEFEAGGEAASPERREDSYSPRTGTMTA